MKKRVLFFFFLFFFAFSFSQKLNRDSLQQILKNHPSDTSTAKTLNLIARSYLNHYNFDSCLYYASQGEVNAKKFRDKNDFGDAYMIYGNVSLYKGENHKSLDYFQSALKLFTETNNRKKVATITGNICLCYRNMGMYKEAMAWGYRSLQQFELLSDKEGIAHSYGYLALVFSGVEQKVLALSYYKKALAIYEKLKYPKEISQCWVNIGANLYEQERYQESLSYFKKALEYGETVGDKRLVGHCLVNIAGVYQLFGEQNKNSSSVEFNQNYNELALKNYEKSASLAREVHDTYSEIISLINMGSIYTNLNEFKEGISSLELAIKKSKESSYKKELSESYYNLSACYEKAGDLKNALKYSSFYNETKDSLLNEASSKQIIEMNAKYESEKKDKELLKKDAQLKEQHLLAERQALRQKLLLLIVAFAFAIGFLLFKAYRQKQKSNVLLTEKNALIEVQKKQVEEKNKKVTDSITYANRIQQAILPNESLLRETFSDSFILFLPKDIVSGDFYWFSQQGNYTIVATADCTGHGVPGAFMSMIGNTLLNTIVNEKKIVAPEKILAHLNHGINNALKQSNNTESSQDDGMEIAIVSFDRSSQKAYFSGANSHLYILENNAVNIYEGDIYSIGGIFGASSSDNLFSATSFDLKKGTMIYLMSDGYQDQFGGEKNKKFSSKQLQNLLLEIANSSCAYQKEFLQKKFKDWMGTNTQLDDVLFLGIRV